MLSRRISRTNVVVPMYLCVNRSVQEKQFYPCTPKNAYIREGTRISHTTFIHLFAMSYLYTYRYRVKDIVVATTHIPNNLPFIITLELRVCKARVSFYLPSILHTQHNNNNNNHDTTRKLCCFSFVYIPLRRRREITR